MSSLGIVSAVIGLALSAAPVASAFAQDLSKLPRKDRIEFFASLAGGAGVARKTRPVDARPAAEGEIVVTAIAGEGVETRSKPAAKGDWVVRNRCAETGNEQYLVAASRFPARYGEPKSAAGAGGFMEFTPIAKDIRFVVAAESAGEFVIEAPWGELQRVRPGDALVQSFDDAKDIYRVQKASFACTYEVTKPAAK